MNTITIGGNVTRDAEQRSTPEGVPVTHFSVADNPSNKGSTIFWECRIYGNYSLAMTPLITRGLPVTVFGSASQQEWTAKDGTLKKQQQINVNSILLQGGKGQANSHLQEAPQTSPVQQQKPTPRTYGLSALKDDDIPF